MAGTVRLWADLPEDCGGAVLTLRLEEGSRSGQRVLSGNSYLGSSNAVFARFVYDNLYALIFGCFTTLLGCIVLAGGYVLGYRREPKRVYGSVFLALFLFLSGMWVVCDSQFPMLFSGNTLIVCHALLVCSMGAVLCLCVRESQRGNLWRPGGSSAALCCSASAASRQWPCFT